MGVKGLEEDIATSSSPVFAARAAVRRRGSETEQALPVQGPEGRS